MFEAISGKERGDQKDKSPRCKEERFKKLPAKDRLGGEGQGEQESRFAIAEEIGVIDDQITQEEEAEQK